MPNVAIYERLGFRLVKEMTLEDHGDTCSVISSVDRSNGSCTV